MEQSLESYPGPSRKNVSASVRFVTALLRETEFVAVDNKASA